MTSSINQLRMNMLDMQTFQTQKANRPTVENIIEEDKEKIFAKKGKITTTKLWILMVMALSHTMSI